MTSSASASSEYLLKAIDEDIDLTDHMNDGVKSLKNRDGGGRVGEDRERRCPLVASRPGELRQRDRQRV